jgi:hypothetical protein
VVFVVQNKNYRQFAKSAPAGPMEALHPVIVGEELIVVEAKEPSSVQVIEPPAIVEPAVQVKLFAEVLPSHSAIAAGTKPATSALKAAFCAFVLAEPSDVKTTDAKIPMIAITTKSSINVKPFLRFFIHNRL